MSDYKETLNLPKTQFPMKANLAKREPEILARWQAMDVYHMLRAQRANCKKFILHDGPPYANGDIHLGHAVNKILKDIIVKSQSLNGFNCPYVPGWDCHGLPIELNVEKKHGKPGEKLSGTQFRQACRDYAAGQVDKQRSEFIRLGVIGDWKNPYLTMDYRYEANIIRTLAKVIEQGNMVRGYKPIHWCMVCQSALAEAELEYIDKTSPSIYVRFAVSDPAGVEAVFQPAHETLGSGPIEVVIWTTTPWTLPANQAIALHSKLTYCLVAHHVNGKKERLIVAEDLLDNVVTQCGIMQYRVLGRCAGSALEKFTCAHPFLPRTSLLVLGDHVTTDVGTGCVHTAPGHGVDDFNVGMHYGLPVDHPVDGRGCFEEDTPFVAGMHVFKSNDTIVDVLQARDRLLFHSQITHSYPHCWRHKKPIIFRATPQWFISMEKGNLRARTLDAIKTVKWLPDWGQARINSMVENSPDWCISRQRCWSVPIPVFTHKKTGDLHPDTLSLMAGIADKIEHNGIDAWYEMASADCLGADHVHYEKSSDGLDVWFDSGVSHACVLNDRSELQFPADVYIEGSDQHRGWFQSSLRTAMVIKNEPPYRQAVTHGFTVDANGHKMSKSLGNTFSPKKVVNKLGADVLRLWVASADYSAEITVSDEVFGRVADTYRRLRNTMRFLLSNTADFDPAQDGVAEPDMVALDAWIVEQADERQEKIKAAYDSYNFHSIYQMIHNFCTLELGSFYLDIIKDRQYTTKTDSLARRSTQTAMYHLSHYMVRWLMPLISFTAEEIWQHMPGQQAEESVLLATWYCAFTDKKAKGKASIDWQRIIALRDCVNKQIEIARRAGQLGTALEAEVALYCKAPLFDVISQLGDELRFVLITSQAKVLPFDQHPDDKGELVTAECWLNIEVSKHEKCARCWHRRQDVGENTDHPTLCARCVDNVSGQGEIRHYA